MRRKGFSGLISSFTLAGISNTDGSIGNLAGLLAVGVAWLPTAPEGKARDTIAIAHAACAVAFFLCIGYVSVFRADDTLTLVRKTEIAERYRNSYRLLGAGMIASPLLALIASALLDPAGNNRSIVFYMEAADVVMFAAYWLVKSREMRSGLADAVGAAAMLKKSEDPEHKRTAPGNLVVAEHDTAYQEMLDAMSARKGVAPPSAGGGYSGPESSRLPTKR